QVAAHCSFLQDEGDVLHIVFGDEVDQGPAQLGHLPGERIARPALVARHETPACVAPVFVLLFGARRCCSSHGHLPFQVADTVPRTWIRAGAVCHATAIVGTGGAPWLLQTCRQISRRALGREWDAAILTCICQSSRVPFSSPE